MSITAVMECVLLNDHYFIIVHAGTVQVDTVNRRYGILADFGYYAKWKRLIFVE